MIRFLRYWVIALFALANISFARAKEADKDMVIAQMNSCVNTLTNIINNKSMSVLEHETNQLLNNLTMEHIVGLSEIAEFREELIDEIGRLSINEEERKLLRRINNLKADNLKWQAFNNALSNTMMLTGGGNNAAQLGFQALVTAARTGLEYKVAKNELEIEELQAMWDLRKSDLEYFVKLRKTAIGIVFSLYQKYNLKESDRLTEQSSLQFSRIVSDGNAGRMIRLLKDNESKYKHLADYYYYLGMGYIDTKNVAKAMEAFSQYEQMYAKTPIYRINEKLGLIALTRLAYLPKRTSSEVEKDISVALSNLPDNEVAIVQCAAIYNSVLNNPAKALSVLRSGLDNENIVDKSSILSAACYVLPRLSPANSNYNEFITAYNNLSQTDLDLDFSICLARKRNLVHLLGQTVKFKEPSSRRYYLGKYLINDEFDICLPMKYTITDSDVKILVEEHTGKDVVMKHFILSPKHAVSLDDINDVKCFKDNPKLKYIFFTEIGKNSFVVKPNIDYDAVINEPTYLHLQQFPDVWDKERKAIVKFLKKHKANSKENVYVAKKDDSGEKGVINTLKSLGESFFCFRKVIYSLTEDVVKSVVLNDNQDNTYVRLFFKDKNKLEICYKMNKDNGALSLCYYKANGRRVFPNKAVLNEFKSSTATQNKNKSNSSEEKSWWKFW
jgi:hypothetical protein